MLKRSIVFALAAVAVVSVSYSVWLLGKVRAYESRHGVSVLADVAATCVATNACAQKQAADETAEVVSEDVKPSEPSALHVVGVEYDDGTCLSVRLSSPPDMTSIRRYVSVEPLNAGLVGIAFKEGYDYSTHKSYPVLMVTGDFAFRTNVTLRIRQGLAALRAEETTAAADALAADFTYVFRRADLSPAAKFVDEGRYLPPGGARTIGIESVNMAGVQAEISRVEPANVVQLLAREERQYKRYYGEGGDSEDTLELSDRPRKIRTACANRPNRWETWRLPLTAAAGAVASNGIFLVAIGNGDKPFCTEVWRQVGDDWQSYGDWYNPPRYRLVCVSDLGLSVRKTGNDLSVWVTSLTDGRPVRGAWVEVYSKANVLVMSGETSADGQCDPVRRQEGVPFAVVVRAADSADMTFMALSEKTLVDETYAEGAREAYLSEKDCIGFAWTERGIYRHGEKIFLEALLRNGQAVAPRPFPVTLQLVSPRETVFAERTALPDATGRIRCEDFSVPDDQPSGKWTLRVKLPGKDGKTLTERVVKIEEFAPPQIRVNVRAEASAHPTNFSFAVTAERLFGGPAAQLRCEGAVVFEDVPFAPTCWKGYRFGNEDLGLKPSFRRIEAQTLGADGATSFLAPLLEESGRPKAMVRATGQGSVFEDGGRPATARSSVSLHYYPYYIGSTLPDWVCGSTGKGVTLPIACVLPTGERLSSSRRLTVRLERIDSVYSNRRTTNGRHAWDCERIRSLVVEDSEIVTRPDADTEVMLPLAQVGDYAVTVSDPETGVSYGHVFYLGSGDDEAVRAPLSNPSEVTMRPDKAFYRVGEVPRIAIRSPFAGFARIAVLREGKSETRILELTNATCEVTLRPVRREDAPNLDVYVSVIQSVAKNAGRLAVRAHGQTTVRVMPAEQEIPVRLATSVVGLREILVTAEAPGADGVTVTVVDEGINLLTGEPTPDPIAAFAQVRGAEHPLYDLFGKILPVDGEGPNVRGVKTGGGYGAEMLGRVSPVGTRRFKPLALWQDAVRGADGKWQATLKLPAFVGEVRVTAVARSSRATGATSVRQKVSPKVVMQPDAPRFAAPGDMFEVSLPLHNRGETDASVGYEILADGERVDAAEAMPLARNASTNIRVRVRARATPGEMRLDFRVRGLGESHGQTIDLPIRPAVAWREESGIARKGEHVAKPVTAFERYAEREFDSPLGEYAAALRWLAEYRHGCLEQTCARVFPIVAAGGIMNGVVTNAPDAVAAGVRRVESMIRENDFVMWPDCTYAPWDREVSLFAAYFLTAAKKSGASVGTASWKMVRKFIDTWAASTNLEVSAYASLVRAVAGEADKDRLFSLYDARDRLSSLGRARLALALAETDERTRAQTLLADAFEPQSVKEASFQLMARVAVAPRDDRVLPLVAWLNGRRDRVKCCWGTTEENAHALMAIGAYYQAVPPRPGERFVAWRRLSLPKPEEVVDEASGLFLSRRLLTVDNVPADLTKLTCGEMLIAELTVTSAVTRVVGDLVIEDLLAGAFEPVHQELTPVSDDDWILRKDLRDDRVLVFSKAFTLEAGHAAQVRYPVRVVSAGEYVLPGPSVEGMYDPRLHARRAPGRVVVRH